MASDLPARGVPEQGVSGRLALLAFVTILAALVMVGLLGKGDEMPPPRSADAALSSATPAASVPWVRAWAGAPTPEPTTTCATPRIDRLAGPIPRHPAALLPSGLRTVGPLSGGVDALVPDRSGGLWGVSAGRLLRFDPDGRLAHVWTSDDDSSLAAWMLVPANDGGVWLVGESALRLFDGERFRDVVPVPGAVIGLAEAADGSLWATAWATGLLHWDGRVWLRVCGSPADTQMTRVALDRDGGVWVSFGASSGGTTPNPARYDGRAWTAYPGEAFTSDAALVATSDGTMWAASGEGRLARFDGTTWALLDQQDVHISMLSSPVAGSDGAVWAIGGPLPGSESGEDVGAMIGGSVLRYDGARWTVYGQADGLPAAEAYRSAVAAVATVGDRAFAAGADGLYRLDGRRWTRTWDARPAVGPGWIASLLPVSEAEAWAVGEGASGSRLWRLLDGRWTAVQVADWGPSSGSVQGRTFSAAYRAGVLAVAGDPGLAILRAGRWTSLARGPFGSVALAEDGRTVYAVGPPANDVGAAPVAATFRLTADGWRRTDIEIGSGTGTSQPPDPTGPLAVDATGRWWLGIGGGWGFFALNTVDDHRVTRMDLPDGVGDAGMVALAAGPTGEVWALLQATVDEPDAPPSMLVARYRDGAWRTFGAADGFVTRWSSRLSVAPDGSLWVAGDGLWRYAGGSWVLVRPGYWDVAFAPDGTGWVVEPSGIARLPADIVRSAPLSDAAATWCAAISDWGAVHDAATALGIDEAAIDARTSAILAARGESADPAAFASVRRLDGQYVRACSAAFTARP